MFFKKKDKFNELEAFANLGFKLVTDPEDESKIVFKKLRECNNKWHFIEINRHASKTLVFSYQPKYVSGKSVNRCVPLTIDEMECCLKTIKKRGWDK